MIETVSDTSLAERLRQRIRREGPITFCDWMDTVLYDSDGGYYCRDSERWGREGDYHTSPERSSLFASTFARYFAYLYDQLGHPDQWTILEAGAGAGRFAQGVLETLEIHFPQVFSATRYVVDEIGGHSRRRAQDRLQRYATRVDFRALDEVEINAGVVFSNELLDAFPVHRLTMHGGALRELYVDVAAAGNFDWLPAPPSSPRLAEFIEENAINLEEGQIIEVALEIENWLKRVCEVLRTGYLVTVDYGADAEELHGSAVRRQGTLRSFRQHQFVPDPLSHPGEQDLTTTVNWTAVQRWGEELGLTTVEIVRQDKFLITAGLLTQLELETQRCKSEAEKLGLSTSAREMILPDGMGSAFQVLVQKKESS